jgi:hypothetical protein
MISLLYIQNKGLGLADAGTDRTNSGRHNNGRVFVLPKPQDYPAGFPEQLVGLDVTFTVRAKLGSPVARVSNRIPPVLRA